MSVRILCCSDTHDGLPPEVDESGVLAWLHAGDCRNGWRKDFEDSRDVLDESGEAWPSAKDAAIARWYQKRNVPILIVKGNHDTADPYHAFDFATDISGRVVEIAPRLFVAGIRWAGMIFADLPGESDLKVVCDSVRRQVQRLVMPGDALIILTHYPAEIPNLFRSPSPQKGFQCVRELIDQFEPFLVIQGHHHEWFATEANYACRRASSFIVNPGPRGAEIQCDVEHRLVSALQWLVK